MALLLDLDYEKLKERDLEFEESGTDRFFVFTHFGLPNQIYTVPWCEVLVVIPPNYNQDGNDMFWTFPRLVLTSNVPIPATNNSGSGDNRLWKGREFCRWSRHWNPQGSRVWRPGIDNIISIYRRIDWAFRNPSAS